MLKSRLESLVISGTQKLQSRADWIPSALTSTTKVRSTKCSQRTTPANIVFIKVHKSGSTTVANILARYALTHDLNIALPDKQPGQGRYNYFGTGLKKVKPVGKGEEYNVLFNHMIYNRSALDRVMPPDTFYCAIMREPVSRFLSAVNYYGGLVPSPVLKYMQGVATNGTDSLAPRLTNSSYRSLILNALANRSDAFQQKVGKMLSAAAPGAGLAPLLLVSSNRKKMELPEVYNSIVFDSGMPLKDQMNETAAQQYIAKLDRELDLMMVMEHIHESLVLLKRKACLELRDIIHFTLNSRRKEPKYKLTMDDKYVLRLWQMADHMAYDHFYKKFWEEVKKEGDSFMPEVRYFQEVMTKVHNFCASNEKDIDILVIHASAWNEDFTLNAHDCKLLQLQELNFQNILLQRAARRKAEAANELYNTSTSV